MTAIVLRNVKGFDLTPNEVDSNFLNVKTDLEATMASLAATIAIANAAVPQSRTIGGAALTANILLKTVGGISLIGTGDIAVGTGGSGTFVGLSDKATADIPTINTPLATVLASHVTATTAAANAAAAAQVTANSKAAVQTGVLVASTIAAAAPTPVMDYVGLQVSTLIGTAASNLNTLGKLALALNSDPNYSATAATATTAALNAANAAQADATTALGALAGKADKFVAVNLGTGSTITVTAGGNADRGNYWSGTGPANITFSVGGSPAPVIGQQLEIANLGTATITMIGVSSATGYKQTIAPGEVGGAEFQGGGWLSMTPSAFSSTALATVTPASGAVGALLTCTPSPGWVGTFQWYWQDTGANISAATSATYTLQSTDASHNVACKFTPTFYGTNAVTVSSGAPGLVTAFAFGTAGTTSLPYSFAAPSSGGTPTSYIIEYRNPPTSGTWLTWGGHSGTTLSGTITGLTSGVTYEGRATAHNASGDGTPSATDTKATSSSKITFNDPFGGALDARWTPGQTGWLSNSGGAPGKLIYTGTDSFGYILANCTAGDNTLAVDQDTGGFSFTYPTIIIRWIDGNNYVYAQLNDGYPRWEVWAAVAGTYTLKGFDTSGLTRGGTGANANRVQMAIVGSSVTMSFIGGLGAGTPFTVTGVTEHASATKCGLGMLSGNPSFLYDNCQLS